MANLVLGEADLVNTMGVGGSHAGGKTYRFRCPFGGGIALKVYGRGTSGQNSVYFADFECAQHCEVFAEGIEPKLCIVLVPDGRCPEACRESALSHISDRLVGAKR